MFAPCACYGDDLFGILEYDIFVMRLVFLVHQVDVSLCQNILHISLRQFRFPGCAIPLLFGRTFFKNSFKIHIPPPPPCPSPQPPPHRPPCRPPRPPPRQPPCRTTCPFVFPSSFPGSTIVLTDEAPRCLAALPHTLMVRDRH